MSLAVSKIKLSHQVKKAVAALGVTSVNDSAIELIFENLLLTNRDYSLEPKRLLVETIRDIMSTALPKSETIIARGGSLNQSMLSSQKDRGLAMKRSRPVEDDSTTPGATTTEPTEAEQSPSTGNGITNVGEGRDKRKRSSANAAAASATVDALLSKSANPTSKNMNFLSDRPKMRFQDLAGLEPIIKQVQELVCYPIQYPQLYQQLGVCPPCGILLHGPSGCGKTTLAAAIAGETGLPYFKVSGPELVGGTSGESEERIRQVFEAAALAAPSVLFIDALDVIAGKKDSHTRGMDRRIIAQLFDSIDYISSLSKHGIEEDNNQDTPAQTIDQDGNIVVAEKKRRELATNKFVVLVVATNKPDNIDPGVRGRFAREIALPVPDAPARSKILQLHTKDMHLSPAIDFATLGKMTPGFVGADLQALAREAGMIAVCRIVKDNPELLSQFMAASTATCSSSQAGNGAEISDTVEGEAGNNTSMEVAEPLPVATTPMDMMEEIRNKVCVEMEDFLAATKTIQPSAKREGFAVAPEVTWSDIGALSQVREELKHNVLEPIAHPERFRALGLEVPAGVLFYGPPGCGKTLLAKALANQSGANFISVKGPELLNMYVGESESRVRQVFARARASAPCVIFFDELDALCPKRSSGWEGSSSSGNGVSERVVNQLLTELDGLESRKDVYIIAATNRLELIDDAMLRPGRLGNLLYVPLPGKEDRASILRALTRKVAVDIRSETSPNGVDFDELAQDGRTEGFSGADLSALVREAGLAVIKEITDTPAADIAFGGKSTEGAVNEIVKIQQRHFEAAFERVRPSVNPQDRDRYERVRKYLQDGMSAIESLRKAYEDTFGPIA